MLTVASIFRDSCDYLDRYFAQIHALEQYLETPIHLVLAEGDSTDETYKGLACGLAATDTLLKVDHGLPRFESVDHAERWYGIAVVCNAVMAEIRETRPDDTIIYIESDLIWEPPTLARLLEDLAIVPAVAPLSMMGGIFYDVWGYRHVDGSNFRHHHPYHDLPTDQLSEISSAGSCVVMRPEAAAVAEWGLNDGMVGLGRSIRHNGYSLWLDPRVAVKHP